MSAKNLGSLLWSAGSCLAQSRKGSRIRSVWRSVPSQL
jgi:hypothetical protein